MLLLTIRTFLQSLDASDWIASAAALIALGSLAYARRSTGIAGEANRIAEDANTIARESRDIAAQGVELQAAAHEDRRREREARAVLSATLEPTELRSEGSHANFRLALVLTNNGDRESGRGTLSLHAPQYVQSMTFAWEDDRHRQDRARARATPEVRLPDFRDRPIGTVALEHEVPNITPTTPARLRFVLPLEVPKEPRAIPLRIVVHVENADPFTQDLSVTIGHGLPE